MPSKSSKTTLSFIPTNSNSPEFFIPVGLYISPSRDVRTPLERNLESAFHEDCESLTESVAEIIFLFSKVEDIALSTL